MKRFLLLSILALGVSVLVGGYTDSTEKEKASIVQVVDQVTGDYIDPVVFYGAISDADFSAFEMVHPDLGSAYTAYIHPAEKLVDNYRAIARPPPDRCQKSVYYIIENKDLAV